MAHSPARWFATVAVGLLISVSGCAGASDDDGRPYKASIGSNERTPETDALGVAIVVDGEGNGRVVGTLLNTTDDTQRLIGADVKTERGPAKAKVIGGTIDLPSDEPVQLARVPAVSVSSDGLPEGFFVELTFELEGAPPIEMLVPVEAQEGPYAEIEVTEPPDGDVSVG